MNEKLNIIDGEMPVFPPGSYFHSTKSTLDVYDQILSSLCSSDRILLDEGCGKKSMVQRYTAKFNFSVGMDISPEAMAENSGFSAFVAGDASMLPFRDQVFDVVVSQWMIEHIRKIDEVVQEFGRVLKKGGSLVVVTNSKYHPMMFVSSILPTRFRDWMKLKIFPSFIEEDTFPTYYRFNSLADIDRLLTRAGFEKRYASYHGAPFFLFNKFLFKISEWYERLTDISFLRCMKMHVLVHYVRK